MTEHEVTTSPHRAGHPYHVRAHQRDGQSAAQVPGAGDARTGEGPAQQGKAERPPARRQHRPADHGDRAGADGAAGRGPGGVDEIRVSRRASRGRRSGCRPTPASGWLINHCCETASGILDRRSRREGNVTRSRLSAAGRPRRGADGGPLVPGRRLARGPPRGHYEDRPPAAAKRLGRPRPKSGNPTPPSRRWASTPSARCSTIRVTCSGWTPC